MVIMNKSKVDGNFKMLEIVDDILFGIFASPGKQMARCWSVLTCHLQMVVVLIYCLHPITIHRTHQQSTMHQSGHGDISLAHTKKY